MFLASSSSCSSTTIRPGGDGGSSDGGSGSDGATCSGTMQSGTVLCSNVIAALCSRRFACKTTTGCQCADCANVSAEPTNECNLPGGSCSSQGGQCSEQTCRTAMMQSPKGYDCTQAKFANVTRCDAVASACLNELPLVACTDSQQETWNWPASCTSFWSQF